MFNALAIVVALLVGASEPPAADPSAAPPNETAATTALPRLYVSARDGRDRFEVALDTATGKATRLDTHASAPIVIPLPGTDLSAELLRSSAHPHRDLYIVRRADDGTELKRTLVCPLSENPRDVAWHVGWQRLVYIRGVGDSATLRSRDPRSEHEATMPVGGLVQDVRIGPDDQIAAVALISLRGKVRNTDLTVFRGRATLRVADGEHIGAFAWHPDGKRIVYSVPGELRMVTIAERSTETVRLADLDKPLWNHLARSIDIAPDGTIALVLNFAGGRASALGADEEPEPLAGDREVYLLDWPDRLRTIELEAEALELHWHVEPATHTSR